MDWINEHTTHGTILDRTRLPHYAVKGLDLKNNGIEMDEAENIPQVIKWIKKFRKKALGAVA
ncbi:hypothetical protein [Profundibacter sp.]|uniref:hypothetical protein n=1 Tax=Profundibacter sp. TaxID=3101071 RepID=UPI003D0E76E6